MNDPLNHNQFLEWIPAYIAGGLDESERQAMQSHAATCDSCSKALAESAQVDETLNDLFAGVQPRPGYEDRMVARVAGSQRRLVHPAVWRISTGIAAALVLGATGYAGVHLLEQQQRASRVVATGAPSTQPFLGYGAWFYDFDGDGVSNKGEVKADVAQSPEQAARAQNERIVHSLAKGVDQQHFWGEFGRGRVKVAESSGEPEVLRQRFSEGKANEQPVVIGGQLAVQGGDYVRMPVYTPDTSAVDRRANGPAAGKRLSEADAGLKAVPVKAYFKVSEAAGELGPSADGRTANGSVEGQIALAKGEKTKSADGVVPGANVDAPTSGGLGGGFGGYGGGGFAGRGYGGGAMGGMGVHGGAAAERWDDKSVAEGERYLKRSGAEGAQVASSATATGASPTAPAAEPAAPTTGASAPAAGATTATSPATPQATSARPDANRKVIRNGELEFEVDAFDSAAMQVARIVAEEGGFVSSTNSEKLANGKVRGTIALRVPPDRLDTLVLKLRALGDLKSQRISAQDVTKVYYDLEGELKAARAMEERLLNIIKSGKGEIKDLLEAEKQLGVYRGKIEKLEGEIRYYNNLVSLSTLNVTLTERDIRTAAFASQQEQVNMGVETEDVEKARASALKAIEESKGRIIESNLKKHDAGQFLATITAEIAPDAAGPLIDRLRQIGRVARLDIERKQTAQGEARVTANVPVQRRDTRFSISIYNLANIAPRQTTNVAMATANVEEAYRSILELVTGKNGRVVSSNLNRQRGDQTTATVQFEVPSADADASLAELRREREVMSLTVTENPDTNNITTAKRGFVVQLSSLAAVPARQSEQLVVAARGLVPEAFNRLLDELHKASARILLSQLNEQEAGNINGNIEFEIGRDKEFDIRSALAANGVVVHRAVSRSADADNTIDSKVRLRVQMISFDKLAPRETQSLSLATKDVSLTYRSLLATLGELRARVITSQLNEQDPRNVAATLDFEIPTEQRERINKALADAGLVHGRTVARSSDLQNTVDLKVRMQLSIAGFEQLPPREKTTLMVEVPDVDRRTAELRDAVSSAGGRIVSGPRISKDGAGRMSSEMVIDVPMDKADSVRQMAVNMGTVRQRDSQPNPQAPEGAAARARLEVVLANPDLLVGQDQGPLSAFRKALSTAITGLLWSLQWIIAGLLILAPWLLLGWAAWRYVQRRRQRTTYVVSDTPPAASAT